MKDQEIINELDSIIAMCDVLKEKATELRRKLERVNAPTSRKRGLTDRQIAEIIAQKRKRQNQRL